MKILKSASECLVEFIIIPDEGLEAVGGGGCSFGFGGVGVSLRVCRKWNKSVLSDGGLSGSSGRGGKKEEKKTSEGGIFLFYFPRLVTELCGEDTRHCRGT